MNPLLELRRLMAMPAPRLTGEIVEQLGDGRYRVAIGAGSIEAISSGAVAFKAGDAVMVRDGSILGRVKSIANVRVYTV